MTRPAGRGKETPAPHRIAAIVLNYRTPELTLACIDSIVPELLAEDALVVVDNASGDGSEEAIRRALEERGLSQVRLVVTPANRGFSAGHNAGIEAISASAYLLLNSDTVLRPGTVARLWAELRADPRIGLVSPRLEWPDGEPQPSCFRFHTPASELIGGSQTGPIRRLLRRWDVPMPVRDEPFDPPWTSFACVLVGREVLDAVGPLDEGFFMYYEDVDFCRRARRAGWRVRHDPRARVVHLRGQSSPVKALAAERKRLPRYYYASRARYLRKHFGRSGLLAANLLWTGGRAIAWLRETFGTKQPHVAERELLDLWRG